MQGQTITQTLKLSEIIQELLGKGYSPRAVRLELAKRGIPWKYTYSRATAGGRAKVIGDRERVRNLKRLGLKVCPACKQSYSVADVSEMCPQCLHAKWAPGEWPF